MFLMTFVLFITNFTDFVNLKILILSFTNNQIGIDFSGDKKTQIFMLVLILIVFSIYLFKKYYMVSEKNNKYFDFLFYWFVASMMIILISQNWILMIVGWDMLGVSSYLLIIFYNNSSSINSGYTTMNTNRFGDMFLITFVVISMSTNFISFNNKWSFVMLMLMVCLMTKSAQFPFSSWLPLAMAAPTPVSSLVHSSTLVTAGLFIMYKTDMMFYNKVMVIMFVIGMWTNLYSGWMATLESDMKKMIALSTLSQISFMVLTLSMGMIYLSFLHLLTHAMFKASLFFWAGMNMHSLKSEQSFIFFNNKSMSMSSSFLYLIFISLIGIPFSMGFYSKDQILDMLNQKMSFIVSVLFFFCVFLTTIYTVRLMKKMTSMSFNKFSLKMVYYNIYWSMAALSIFACVMLTNKLMNETWFKSTYILVTSGWKSLFLGCFSLMILSSWWIKGFIKLKSMYKMNYLNYFTMKMMSMALSNNNKSMYLDFGWSNNFSIKFIKNMMKSSKEFYKISKNKLMLIMVFSFFMMNYMS